MTVSVVVTCFNLERYIGRAIESVLSQDIARDVEIIVVDDCSSDGSHDRIREFESVRYVRTERNSGVLLATLQGIEEASGDCLFFLDGDDIWEPTKLRACMAAFERDAGCLMVTHDLAFMDADGMPLPIQSRPGRRLDALDDEERSAKIIDGLQRLADFIWLGSAWGVRRSLGRLDEFISWARQLPDPANTYQDWPMAMWLASLPNARAAYLPQKLFRYRLHGANHSGDARSAAKAARNFARARNTAEAMRSLAVERGLSSEVQTVLGNRVRANDYLTSLYLGERRKALTQFPAALKDFRRSKTIGKEILRLAGVQLIGASRFARLSAISK
jgi:glycosyltransferase involved in cell wall biosynthesis